MLGYFENDNPYIDIEVTGHPSFESKPLKVLVDSGFNGHLQISFALAFPLGLSLVGVQQLTIADGSTVNQFVCLGDVKIDNKEIKNVPINIGAGCPTLLGTKLLKAAGKNLRINFVLQEIEISDHSLRKNRVS